MREEATVEIIKRGNPNWTEMVSCANCGTIMKVGPNDCREMLNGTLVISCAVCGSKCGLNRRVVTGSFEREKRWCLAQERLSLLRVYQATDQTARLLSGWH